MKLFISYAHADHELVKPLAEMLNVMLADGTIWYDTELIPSQAWWDSILDELETCDLFIFALTPNSTASLACQTEYQYALDLNKAIFPILLNDADLPIGKLSQTQYADARDLMSRQTALSVARALLYLQPRILHGEFTLPDALPARPDFPVPPDPFAEFREVIVSPQNFDRKDHAHIVFELRLILRGDNLAIAEEASQLLAQLGNSPYISKGVAEDIESALARYTPQVPAPAPSIKIAQPTQNSFQLPAPFAWIEIPAGEVTLEDKDGFYGGDETFDVAAFEIAKYPITNAQFERFMKDGGYGNAEWWTVDGEIWKRDGNWAEPRFWQDGNFNRAKKPVVGVSWYEAAAFCQWMSYKTGWKIMLPSELQWQRAAQGDDGRIYPWGNEWDCKRCNNSVEPCTSKKTTLVQQYEGTDKGDSPFGVVDMAGNAWEWCLTDVVSGRNELIISNTAIIRGGSMNFNVEDVFRVGFRNAGNPRQMNNNIGFRIARLSE